MSQAGGTAVQTQATPYLEGKNPTPINPGPSREVVNWSSPPLPMAGKVPPLPAFKSIEDELLEDYEAWYKSNRYGEKMARVIENKARSAINERRGYDTASSTAATYRRGHSVGSSSGDTIRGNSPRKQTGQDYLHDVTVDVCMESASSDASDIFTTPGYESAGPLSKRRRVGNAT